VLHQGEHGNQVTANAIVRITHDAFALLRKHLLFLHYRQPPIVLLKVVTVEISLTWIHRSTAQFNFTCHKKKASQLQSSLI
jgi:hypothetical protein